VPASQAWFAFRSQTAIRGVAWLPQRTGIGVVRRQQPSSPAVASAKLAPSLEEVG
jgi:hypothetical protein